MRKRDDENEEDKGEGERKRGGEGEGGGGRRRGEKEKQKDKEQEKQGDVEDFDLRHRVPHSWARRCAHSPARAEEKVTALQQELQKTRLWSGHVHSTAA